MTALARLLLPAGVTLSPFAALRVNSAKGLARWAEMLRCAQHDSSVMLSAAKHLCPSGQTLRGVYPERSEWAQGDTRGKQQARQCCHAEIGRASCRERGKISVVAVSLK